MVNTYVLMRFRLQVLLLAAVLLLCGQAVIAEELSLVAEDGQRLAATLVRPQSEATGRAVLLLHMFRHDRSTWEDLQDELAERGLLSLALDLRGHGDSRMLADGSDGAPRVLGRDTSLFARMYFDAAAGFAHLRDQEGIAPERIAVVGASVGCSVALHGVAQGVLKPGAVVLMTPGKDYLGLDSLTHVRDWPGIPVLIMSSEEERGRGADALYGQLRGRGAELRLFSRINIHGTRMFDELDDGEGLIADWLQSRLWAVDLDGRVPQMPRR